jgi:hypothetical protein
VRLLDTINVALLDIQQWPGVDEGAIENPAKLKQYKARRLAVELLINEAPRAQFYLRPESPDRAPSAGSSVP